MKDETIIGLSNGLIKLGNAIVHIGKAISNEQSWVDGIDELGISNIRLEKQSTIKGIGLLSKELGFSSAYIKNVLEGKSKPGAELAKHMCRLGLKPGSMA